MLEYIIVILWAILFLFGIASIYDIFRREVPDVIMYVLLMLSIIFFILNYQYLNFVGISIVILITIANLLWYFMGYWALGEVFSLESFVLVTQNVVSLLTLFYIMGVFLVLYVALYNYIKHIKVHERKDILKEIFIVLLGLILIKLSYYMNYLFVPELLMAMIVILLIALFWNEIKEYQRNAFYLAGYKDLVEGDWLLEPVRHNGKIIVPIRRTGINKEDIEKIKRLGIKVKVKRGIPLIPAFFFSLLLLIFIQLF